MFRSAEPYQPPPHSLAASLFLHAFLLAMLFRISFPNSPSPPHQHRLRAILLAPAPLAPVPLAPARLAPARLAPKRAHPVFRARKIGPVVVAAVLTPPLLTPPLAPLPVSLPEPAPPPLSILTTAPPVPLTPPVKPRVATGSFDAAEPVPAGAAHRGTSTRVSGFGDAETASSPIPIPVSNPGVSNFGDTTVTNPARRIAAASASATIPVEILEKPRPAYTDEARRLNIQGEVLLQVAFDASGDARVLRVIHGLGHGLDETAIAATRRIRFRPARREGQPVDSSAVVHIVFQLAN